MFYSHEILTSRKHGVATVWLVATLGNRASPKKVNRRTILEVDIPKACDVVIQPEAPMALRLQSNLLSGISRVYAQQCGYVLIDAQNVQQQMRQLIRVVQSQSNDLDIEVGRSARPEHLLLPDDPNFLPDLELQLDINLLNMDSSQLISSQTEQLLSSQGKPSSQSSAQALLDIQIPSSSGGGGGMDFPSSGPRFQADQSAAPANEQDLDGDIILPQAEFTFDPDGNIFDVTHYSRGPSPAGQAGEIGGSGQMDDVQNEVLPVHEPPIAPMAGNAPPDASLYTAGQELQDASESQAQAQASDGYHPSENPSQHTSEETATAAAARRAKPPRTIATDTRIEISRTELMSWNTNYLANMDAVRHKRDALRAGIQSKKNAEWWVWGAGLGGIGYDMRGPGNITHPLAMFQGAQLRELVLGPSPPTKKRGHANASEDAERRVRPRSNEPEDQGAAAHNDIPMHDAGADAEPDEPELARGAPTPGEQERPFGPDLSSSSMPWNVSAGAISLQRGRGGTAPAVSASGPQAARPGSRLTSASPLVGRGFPRRTTSRQSSLGPVQLGELGDPFSSGADDFAGGLDLNLDAGIDEYDRFGPAAGQDTPLADSQWVRQQLDLESVNFLDFVSAGIGERRGMAFAELLPPEANTHVVAAQGLLHVLTLASKGVLWVEQDEAFDAEILVGLNAVKDAENDARAPLDDEAPAAIGDDADAPVDGDSPDTRDAHDDDAQSPGAG